MKNISQNPANGGFNGNPLRKDYFAANGRRAVKSNRLPEEFCRMDQQSIPAHTESIQQTAGFQSSPEASFRWKYYLTFRGQGHRPKFAIVRIYYLKVRFIKALDRILRGQFCVIHCTKQLKNSAILTN
jgi:hypothetical protein